MGDGEVDQAKQQLELERQKAADAQKEVARQQEILNNPNLLRRYKLSYLLAPKYKSQKFQALDRLGQAQQEINVRNQELNKFELEIKDYERQIAEREAYESRIARIERAYKLGQKGAPVFKGDLKSQEEKAAYKAGAEGRLYATEKNFRQIADAERAAGKLRQFYERQGQTPTLDKIKSDLARLGIIEKTPEIITKENELKSIVFEDKLPEKVVGVAEPKGYLESIQQKISKARSEGGLKALGAGIGQSYLSSVELVSNLYNRPKETAKQIGQSLKTGAERFVSGEGFPEIGKIIYQEPEFTTGYAVAEASKFYGPKLILKGVDVYRVRGLTELPEEVIVAPEFAAGQRFPAIAKGESAGELLREFKQPEIYGVTKLSGFTATSKPFPKVTEALRGTSELPGVYQAPKLSPTFLRIAGEDEAKLFGLNPFGTLRPTAIKILPKQFELIEGVVGRQRSLESFSTKINGKKVLTPRGKEIVRFFEKTAEPGKSYIPFIKTEKEAIITAGTKIGMTDKRFFFKFEGRKIPIFEYDIIDDTGKKLGTVGEDIRSVSSRYAPRSEGLIDPYRSFLSAEKSRYISKNLNSSRYVSKTSSSAIPLISISKIISSSSRKLESYSGLPLSSISPPPSYSYNIYPPSYTGNYPYIRIPGQPYNARSSQSKNELRKSKIKRRKAYSVLLRRRGRFIPIATNLPRGRALRFGSDRATRELSRQFRIVESGLTENEDIYFKPSEKIFRTYKVRSGKKISISPDTYIQRISANLQTTEEKALIKSARFAR